jgi:hypothetical protein
MQAVITPDRPDAAAAVVLIAELDAQLAPLYPARSGNGYSVKKLTAEQVALFVLRVDGTPAGCGGVQLFGSEYGSSSECTSARSFVVFNANLTAVGLTVSTLQTVLGTDSFWPKTNSEFSLDTCEMKPTLGRSELSSAGEPWPKLPKRPNTTECSFSTLRRRPAQAC